MEVIRWFRTLDVIQSTQVVGNVLFSSVEFRRVSFNFRGLNIVCEIISNRVRQNEISVGQTLHQSRGTQAVSTVVWEVTFSDSVQSRDGCHQVVVNPKTSHRVVDCRVNHHRIVVRVNSSDLFVHLEQVSVTFLDYVSSQTVDSVFEIQEHGFTGVVYSESGIASFFSGAGCHVTRNQVSECWVTTLQVEITIFVRNIVRV